MAQLTIDHVGKDHGATRVLGDVSLAVADGELLVLVGPSGCGKSTLLRCIAGLEELSRGAILMDGVDITRAEPRDRDIAMVFQSYALYPRPANLFVAKFIGTPEMNVIDARAAQASRLTGALEPEVASVGVRAEDLRLATGGVAAQVDVVEHLGAEALVHVRVEMIELV